MNPKRGFPFGIRVNFDNYRFGLLCLDRQSTDRGKFSVNQDGILFRQSDERDNG